MKPKSSNKKPVTFWITSNELEKFDYVAKEKQTSRAALLRSYMIETNKKEISTDRV